MTPPWTAEHDVSPTQACTLIEGQFPDLAPVHVEPFGKGWDNTAYRVNEAYLFRFPRRQLGADCMEAEIAVLPHLASHLPLPIPHPVCIGAPTDAYPWSFAGYRILDGQTACAAALNDEQRTRLAEPLAHFLASLHAFPTPEVEAWGAGPDTLARLDVPTRVPKARQSIEAIHQRHLLPEVSALSAIVDDMAQRQTADQDTRETPIVLVHGDLYARHLLVDDQGALCGIIDWGDVHAGRAATDLAIAHSFLPPAAHDTFRHAYGPIPEVEWRMARFRAVYHTATVATYAHDIGDEALLQESLTALRFLISKNRNRL